MNEPVTQFDFYIVPIITNVVLLVGLLLWQWVKVVFGKD